tara:strand:+ start:76 stop:945 length:870 start_codon:yes stop_codon:yes gene_type:complete
MKKCKAKETVTNTFVCESEGCEKTYQITRKKWTTRGALSNPHEKSRFKFCSVKCSREEATRRNQVAKQQNPNSLGLDINGNPRLTYDKNGNYPTTTCPYCQGTFERRYGHRQKVCKNAECQYGWKLFQGIWNRKYGSIKDWPYIPKDITKRKFTRNCIGCKKGFSFIGWWDAEGNPIVPGGQARAYCKESCFDKHYREELATEEQKSKYRDQRIPAAKKRRDNIEDSYVKAVLQAQFIDDGFSISSKEFSQEMIEDKRNLLKLKRAYKKATGCTMQSLSYSSTMGSRWH